MGEMGLDPFKSRRLAGTTSSNDGGKRKVDTGGEQILAMGEELGRGEGE